MPDDRSWPLRFMDIIQAAERINGYIENLNENEFRQDRRTVDAVSRNIILIGDASAKLDDAIRESLSTIPWGDIIGMRNILVHEYFRVDNALVWEVATQYVPSLAAQLQSALQSTDAP